MFPNELLQSEILYPSGFVTSHRSGCATHRLKETSPWIVSSKAKFFRLKLVRFSASEMIEVMETLRGRLRWIGLRMVSIETSRRDFGFDRMLDLANKERQLNNALMSVGVDINTVKLK